MSHTNGSSISSITDLSGIQAIIWDLDGTLYRFDEDFLVACNHAAAKAAIHLGVPLKLDEAVEFAWQSHAQTGQSILHFLRDYEIKVEQMHDVYHELIDEKLIKTAVQTKSLFQSLKLPQIIITHASKDWAARVLAHLGLKEYFPDTHILGKEDYQFQSKCSSPLSFDMGLEILGVKPEAVVVVEDTVKNLKIAADKNMHTALLHYGRPPKPMPSYVDYNYNNVNELLGQLV